MDVWPPLQSFDRRRPPVDRSKLAPDMEGNARPFSSLDLWLDGIDMDESAGWRQELVFDFDRFISDDQYAKWISDHITHSLANLAKEIEEIGTKMPYTSDWGDISECP